MRANWHKWLIFTVGGLAYFVAVVERTSMGVAGVVASRRFEVTAAELSLLGVLQLVVYAAMQIPVGVLLDRFGARILVTVGTLAMGCGQLLVALSPSFSGTAGGRMLVGLGDAMIFISVIRLVGNWFSRGRASMMNQLIGLAGAMGQLFSSLPFAFYLHDVGWERSFSTLSLLAFGAAIIAFMFLVEKNSRAAPGLKTAPLPVVSLSLRNQGPMVGGGLWRSGWDRIRQAIGERGTWLAFWVHYSCQSFSTVFALFWGFPFMVRALGYSPGPASLLLLCLVLTTALLSPFTGWFLSRFYDYLLPVALVTWGLNVLAWLILIFYPGSAPWPVMLLVVILIGTGYPGSMTSFDIARLFNPPLRQGTAIGIVNTGGFTASFVGMFLIGFLLDLANRLSHGSAADLYRLENFRFALSIQLAISLVGFIFMLVLGRRVFGRRLCGPRRPV